MKTYVVGGAVRDRLLGLPVVDRDHVVIGATVDEMLAAGFQPVGRDFPVFLHPKTQEEYALARTERKVAPGYAGFVFHADPTVTLEADLERRDLTINAIAEDEASGTLIDPFGGRRDLADRVFRHVGPAFSEDPVRLLRVARFAARFVDFRIAPETIALMRGMTQAGEIDALVPERVWQEIARGLMERRPSRMFDVLRDTGALARVLPELDALFAGTPAEAGPDTLRSVDRAATAGAALEVRFAVLLHRIGVPSPTASARPVEDLCRRVAVPRASRELAVFVRRERDPLVAALSPPAPATASQLAGIMERGDAFRRGPRFVEALEAIGYTLDDDVRAPAMTLATRAFEAAAAVDAGAIAREVGYDARLIGPRVRAAREATVEHVLRPSAG